MKQTLGPEELQRRFTDGFAGILGDNLAGVYLHGSAAMGCFREEVSDLDLLAVVRESPDDAAKLALMDVTAGLDALGPAKGIEMSVVRKDVCRPFVYPTPFELHYSRMHLARYRSNPEEYVRTMKGTDKDLAAHFTVIRRRGIRLYGEPAGDVFGEVPADDYLDALLYDVGDAREEITNQPCYLTLNLARVLAWVTDGAVLSKQEGGEWGLRNLPERFLPAVRQALAAYGGKTEGEYDPDVLREYAGYVLDRIPSPARQEDGK